MKYPYVYLGVGIGIVSTGIFLIYLLELKQENPDLIQQNQIDTIPKLSEDQAIQIIKSDLSKHLPNIDRIVIIGKDTLPFNPTYPKFPQRLIFVLPNGTELFINHTDYSALVVCVPETSFGFCPSQGKEELQATTGKLFYISEAWWSYKGQQRIENFAVYFIDAHNGDILYSNLLENMHSSDIATQYRP